MKINLAKSAGFCFGVKRAIDIALKTAKMNNKVYMLGDIVHNEEVVKQIRGIGIKKIKMLGNGKNKILLIRAHGIDKNTYQKARKAGYAIIDATCPMVKEIHKIARTMEGKGYKIIVIGDKKHDEVHGIIGELKKPAFVIEDLQKMPPKKIRDLKKACAVVQSTQNIQNVLKIAAVLKKYINDFKFFNTICGPTRLKQREINMMPLKNDVMIIIGSKNSANTKRLYQISKTLNKRTYWVNAESKIRRDWFNKTKTVGITAGASTPRYLTQTIIKYIQKLN